MVMTQSIRGFIQTLNVIDDQPLIHVKSNLFVMGLHGRRVEIYEGCSKLYELDVCHQSNVLFDDLKLNMQEYTG